ncbi:uncharacterized protein [Oscarella lobularis]
MNLSAAFFVYDVQKAIPLLRGYVSSAKATRSIPCIYSKNETHNLRLWKQSFSELQLLADSALFPVEEQILILSLLADASWCSLGCRDEVNKVMAIMPPALKNYYEVRMYEPELHDKGDDKIGAVSSQCNDLIASSESSPLSLFNKLLAYDTLGKLELKFPSPENSRWQRNKLEFHRHAKRIGEELLSRCAPNSIWSLVARWYTSLAKHNLGFTYAIRSNTGKTMPLNRRINLSKEAQKKHNDYMKDKEILFGTLGLTNELKEVTVTAWQGDRFSYLVREVRIMQRQKDDSTKIMSLIQSEEGSIERGFENIPKDRLNPNAKLYQESIRRGFAALIQGVSQDRIIPVLIDTPYASL